MNTTFCFTCFTFRVVLFALQRAMQKRMVRSYMVSVCWKKGRRQVSYFEKKSSDNEIPLVYISKNPFKIHFYPLNVNEGWVLHTIFMSHCSR